MILRIAIALLLLVVGIYTAPAIAAGTVTCRVEHAIFGHSAVPGAAGDAISVVSATDSHVVTYNDMVVTLHRPLPGVPAMNYWSGTDQLGTPYTGTLGNDGACCR